MFEFLRRLFKKDEAPPPDSVVQELWNADLSRESRGRFSAERGEGYVARYAHDSLELGIERPDVFAWTEAPIYRYADFALEGELEFDASCGDASGGAETAVASSGEPPHSAGGFLFRYQDESNFYSLLVSNRGFFRLDTVFNGKPRPLIAWTAITAGGGSAAEDAARAVAAPAPAERGLHKSVALMLIARGSHVTIAIDGRWMGEAVDESFRTGKIAFAAQNYGEAPRAGLRLRSCLVESRPVEVEARYYRWNYYIVPDRRARRELAETFFSMGEYLAAAVQLRKIERRVALDADELFLKAEATLRLGLQDEAQAALDACIAADPGRRDALEEKANLLYLRGRALELRDWLESLKLDPAVGPSVADNARLAGLSGHARFALGDFAGAAAEYRRAAELEAGSGDGAGRALFRMNEARAWDQAGRKEEAAAAYLLAARLFFIEEADDDLSLALGRLAALKPRGAALREIKAKALYRQGKHAEAGRLLAELARHGSADSAVHYLLGMLKASRGEREEALTSFARALELEPGYALYAFRYAESLFLAGRRGQELATALERALELAPTEGWTLNLAGQAALDEGDRGRARALLEAARAVLPGSPEPVMNLAELESAEGRLDEALALLSSFPDSAACRNLAGNALSRAAQSRTTEEGAEADASRREALLERAAREYEAATALEPGKGEYQENLAAAFLELERYSDAEERIRKALDLTQAADPAGRPSARACLLAGNLAMVYGDRPRAETAYRLGLAAAPADALLLAALGACYLTAREMPKVRECIAKLRRAKAESQALRLESGIVEATTETFSCSSCGRTWRVPREIPAQSGSSIRAMPPDDSPAGSCPSCGRIFCIACRKAAIVDSRFTCPDCGVSLKLSDNRLRWLVRQALKRG